jgi:hypothetical protein
MSEVNSSHNIQRLEVPVKLIPELGWFKDFEITIKGNGDTGSGISEYAFLQLLTGDPIV